MIHDPKQLIEAKALSDRARLALEHVLPPNTQYVVAIMAPGFGTHASNVPKRDQLELLQGLVAELQRDAMGQGFTL